LARALAGATQPSGTLATQRFRAVNLIAALGLSGIVQRKMSKATQGAVNPVGAVTRRTSKGIGGQIGLSGQLSRTLGKALSGFILPQGSFSWLAIGHDFLVLLAGTEGARFIIGALSAIRYRLESRSQSRYGPSHTGEASDDINDTSSSKDDL
jgi:hypothetical protein